MIDKTLLFVLWHLSTQPSIKTAIIGKKYSYEDIFKFLRSRGKSCCNYYLSIEGIKLGPTKPKSLYFLNIDTLEHAVCGFRFNSIILLDEMAEENIHEYIRPHLSTCGDYVEIQEALRFEEILMQANFFKSEWKFQQPKPTFFNLTELT